ncbi:MAG: hypothetical protein ABW252_08585 [Polyangiales bacterium]
MNTNRDRALSAASPLRACSVALFLCMAVGCADDEHELAASSPETVAQVAAPPVASEDASSSCGQRPASDPRQLLDVGHAGAVSTLVRVGDRVVSQDGQRWVLWDVPSGRQLASGEFSASWTERRPATSDSTAPRPADPAGGPRVVPVDLVGDTLITPGPLRFDVRSARDGRVLATIPIDDRVVTLSGIARDESYVYVASNAHLRVWDRTGRLLNELAGRDFRRASATAEPGELRVAGGTLTSVEILRASGEHATSPAYAGTFQTWFLDGSHFVTRQDAEARIYRHDGTLVRALPLPPMAATAFATDIVAGGDGQFAWVYGTGARETRLHRVSDGALLQSFVGSPKLSRRTAQATFTLGAGRVRFVDLRGATPTFSDREAPQSDWPDFAIDGAGNYAIGDARGALHVASLGDEAAPKRLGCGAVTAIAGVGDEVALATGDGRVRFYDLTGGARTLLRTLDAPAHEIAYVDGGRNLVTQGRPYRENSQEGAIRVLDAATGELVHTWPDDLDPAGAGRLYGFVTATHADRIARVTCRATQPKRTCTIQVAASDGTEIFHTQPYLSDRGVSLAASLSPDGKRLAVLVGRAEDRETSVQIYEEGVLAATVPDARGATWLDDERLLLGLVHPTHRGTVLHVADARGVPQRALPGTSVPPLLRSFSPDYYVLGTDIRKTDDGALVWNAFRALDWKFSFTNATAVVLGKQVVFSGAHEAIVDKLP